MLAIAANERARVGLTKCGCQYIIARSCMKCSFNIAITESNAVANDNSSRK